jgi:hypothetical protein
MQREEVMIPPPAWSCMVLVFCWDVPNQKGTQLEVIMERPTPGRDRTIQRASRAPCSSTWARDRWIMSSDYCIAAGLTVDWDPSRDEMLVLPPPSRR